MWKITRCVEPEWLDALPADDPRAVRSRRDLRWINACMLQSAIMARALTRSGVYRQPCTLLDLGAGDGTFMLRVAQRLASVWPDVTVILLDRQNIISAETRRSFRALQWNVETISADAFDFLEHAPLSQVDIVTANLFLHHFSREPLARLLALAANRTRLFVACEPRRAPHALTTSRLLWAIGCNAVSRHDALVSVCAGFSGSELSSLWPANGEWIIHEQLAIPFSHCFVARRVPSDATQ